MVFTLSKEKFTFPDPSFADADGLLAIGGDLQPLRLLNAYQKGIFPWFEDDDLICWYSPHERFVLDPNQLHLSKSMRKFIGKTKLKVTFDYAFKRVIQQCAKQFRQGQGGTWITEGMQEAYTTLHILGHAHSVEVWEDQTLVGGLYGVAVGSVFCGESMFSRQNNASKLALYALCESKKYNLIDCQLPTEHLTSLGAKCISRAAFQKHLHAF